jgi:ubiquitin-conjugating enzyme E2 O
VEADIPSPELFPIHYLDELEFFPGDYVVDAKGWFMHIAKYK